MNLNVLAWALVLSISAAAADPASLRVDFSRTNGPVRRLHGLNKGPLAAGGLIDLTDRWRELAPPLTRLHDCQWPFSDVVDLHSLFRDPAADPANPDSYDWLLTDSYLAAIRQTGAAIVFRLGESIEHWPVKRFVHPPRDPDRWAAVCLGVIRHYNEGWAAGVRYNIRYWEIWNEPENRPTMWSGSDDDYLRLYRTAARSIKQRFPDLKVGGPATGYPGRFDNGRFVPAGFVTNFLASCRRDSVPLDFFSWHCYTADPGELVTRARAIRGLLDAAGFVATESHLNEWNYLPGDSWDAFSKSASPEFRRRFYERMSGAEGAAFVAVALIELQAAPLDVSNFYHGELGAFGIFDEYGGPNKVFYALRAFSNLARLDWRVPIEGPIPGKLAALAAKQNDGRRAAVLLSNFHSDATTLQLSLAGAETLSGYHVWTIDSQRSWQETAQGRIGSDKKLQIDLPAPGVALVEINP